LTTTLDVPSESIIKFPDPDFVAIVFPETSTFPRVEIPVTVI